MTPSAGKWGPKSLDCCRVTLGAVSSAKMKGRRHPSEEYLPWDEVRPSVELAGFVALKGERRYNYRNPAHHLILVDSGRIECDAPGGSFVALPGDLICFRPAERNRYTSRGQTTFYQAVIEFAPPPRHRLTPVWDDVGPLPVKVSLGDAMTTVRRHFEVICLELPHAGSVHQLRVRIAVFEILAIIAGLARKDEAGRDPRRPLATRPNHVGITTRLRISSGSPRTTDGHERQPLHPPVPPPLRRDAQGLSHPRPVARGCAAAARPRSFGEVGRLSLGLFGNQGFHPSVSPPLRGQPSDLRGTASGVTDVVSPPRELLFAVNQHILPPHVGLDYLNQYLVRPSK